MWRFSCKVSTTLAVMALAGIAGLTWVDAHGAESRSSQEHRAYAGRSAAQRAEVRPHQYASPAAAMARRDAFRTHAVATYRPQINERGMTERHLAGGGGMSATYSGGGRGRGFTGGSAANQLRVVRYGGGLSGTVERTIRPGFVSRTFVSGGHVLYARVYQRHVWYQFGRSFAYEAFVPAVRYPGVYYAWALGAWRRPLVYSWGWQVQPWYPMYGALFTPYPVYTSPDLWMTDYIIAQSMQTAYQAQTAAAAPQPSPLQAPVAPAPDSSVAAPAEAPSDPTSAAPPSDEMLVQPTAQPTAQPISAPAAPVSPPPAITPEVKAQLDGEIKVQLQEQQAAAATPATLTTESTPRALRSNHVFFQVVQPLKVPFGDGNRYCSLSANDYIRRTGGISNDDWTIPVVVELSRSSDCPQGAQARISLNDLNTMENEQEAQVMQAMQAASKSLGANGPPSGPDAQPTLVAAGDAAPDPSALNAIQQAQ